MDIKEYISSGILENYVLGIISEQERYEVEEYARLHPEIKREIAKIEAALEEYAQMRGVPPPPNTLKAIMSRIRKDGGAMSGMSGKLLGGLALLFAVSTALLGWLYFNSNAEVGELNNRIVELTTECDEKSNELQQRVDILRNAGGKVIAMGGTDKTPDARTTLYWNAGSRSAYLDVVNLPTPPADKQYQLWAIVEGTPVDMGVFEINATDTLVPAPFIENPAAFAITLEKKGGSPTPTLDEMVVIGEVS